VKIAHNPDARTIAAELIKVTAIKGIVTVKMVILAYTVRISSVQIHAQIMENVTKVNANVVLDLAASIAQGKSVQITAQEMECVLVHHYSNAFAMKDFMILIVPKDYAKIIAPEKEIVYNTMTKQFANVMKVGMELIAVRSHVKIIAMIMESALMASAFAILDIAATCVKLEHVRKTAIIMDHALMENVFVRNHLWEM